MDLWYHKIMDGAVNKFSNVFNIVRTTLHAAWQEKSETKYNEALSHVKKITDKNELGNILLSASTFNGIAIVKYLVEEKLIPVNFQNDYNNTALIKAVDGHSFEIVKYLIEHGADVNSKNNHGETPLWTALERGRTDIAEYLRSKGADINYMNTIAKENFTLKEQAKGEFGLDW